jgi:hypothetical protein
LPWKGLLSLRSMKKGKVFFRRRLKNGMCKFHASQINKLQ